jgi:hypothetical protein
MALALPMPWQASLVHLAPCALIVLAFSVSGRGHTRHLALLRLIAYPGGSPWTGIESDRKIATGVPFQNEA